LRAGEFVRVRPKAEILATLDGDGALDGLPFMPEMAAWCGRTYRVASRADKTCDTVLFSGQRRMRDAVHLEGLRCDGSAHGGCQAGCLTFWKEAWLTRVTASPPRRATGADRPRTGRGCTDADLMAATQPTVAAHRPVFSCQATRVLDASERLRWFDPRQYVREARSRDADPRTAAVRTAVYVFNCVQNLTRRFFPPALRLRGGGWYPFVYGRLTATPTETLGLAPGDLVEVKSKPEILATLDRQGRNRGMSFDGEMVPYCGRRMRVLRRVEKIIDERTGRMRHLKSDAIVLDGGVCTGRYHGMCPRSTYVYWREIWLRPVSPANTRAGASTRAGTDGNQCPAASEGQR
jgi:hypothetical protein